jgi:hypothetical protein
MEVMVEVEVSFFFGRSESRFNFHFLHQSILMSKWWRAPGKFGDLRVFMENLDGKINIRLGTNLES